MSGQGPLGADRWRRGWAWVRRTAKAAVQFVRNHPSQALVGVVVGLALLSNGVLAWNESRADQAQTDRVLALPTLTLDRLAERAQKGEIKTLISHELSVGGWLTPRNQLYYEAVDGKGVHYAMERVGLSEETDKALTAAALTHPIVFETGYRASQSNRLSAWTGMALMLGVLVLVLLVAQLMIGEVLSGKSFKPERLDPDLTLDDVIGYEEVKRELREVMDQIQRASHYASHGMKAPRGVLLTGDPGVGKTMMAKAVANSLGATFFYCTGADFAEMYVGVGAKRVRHLFHRARQSTTALIFIDEIDALGSRSEMGNDSERLATLNQMLAELDGVNGNGRLLVLGATNFPERLDPALVRAGRFDKKIHIPLPDPATRVGILAKYLQGVTLGPGVDLPAMAQRTQGYTGAQLSQLVSEAKNVALRARPRQPVVIEHVDLEEAQEVALLGHHQSGPPAPQSDRIAVHELGHALLAHLDCRSFLHVEKVTLLGRGKALGYTLSRPLSEDELRPTDQLMGQLAMMLGGRAAEEEILGSVSTGAADDLERANALARRMVGAWGMGPRTGLRTGGSQPNAAFADDLEADVLELLAHRYDHAKATVRAHRDWLEDRRAALVEHRLLGHEALFGAQVGFKVG